MVAEIIIIKFHFKFCVLCYLGVRPLSSSPFVSPSIVYVLPVLVCPYANTVPLYPSAKRSTIFLATVSKISDCVDPSSNVREKRKLRRVPGALEKRSTAPSSRCRPICVRKKKEVKLTF